MLIPPLDAAKMIQADRDGQIEAEARLDIAGCQSSIILYLDQPVLVIQGSNERSDWVDNLDFLPERKRQLDVEQGDVCWWHRGFLRHAQVAYSWARDKNVAAVIGHSLGAACVQIVAPSLAVDGLGFGSPRALWAPRPNSPRPENEYLVVNYLRTDDAVTKVPPERLGFEHSGEERHLIPAEEHPGQDHSIEFYIDLLQPVEPTTA